MEYTGYNFGYALVGVIIYVIMLTIAKPHITYKNTRKNNVNKGIVFFFFLYIVNSVYGLWEWDTYHIWEDFDISSKYGKFEILSYEAVYNWLGGITGNNYFLWRALIWTPACLFMYYIAKQLNLLNRNFLVALALYAGFAAYTRGMLGHTMMLYGVVLFTSSERKIIKIIGFTIVIVSYFFHKSMFVNIIFALFAFIPFEKRIIRLSWIVFPFLTVVATYLIDSIVSGTFALSLGEGVGGVGDRTVGYAGAEKMELNYKGVIAQFIYYIPEYLAVFYIYNRVFVKNYFGNIRNEQVFKYLARLMYVAIYVASLFFFVETSSWIYLRFKYMCFFPMVFVLGKLWSIEPKTNTWIKSIIILQLFALFYKYSFMLYKWYQL